MGGVAHPAELVDAHGPAAGEFKQGAGVGEVVGEHTYLTVKDAVAALIPVADAADADGVPAGCSEHPAHGVGGVEHGRVAGGALPVFAAAVLVGVVEAEVHVVDVVALGVEDPAEGALGILLAGKHGCRVVVAGLTHHVRQPGLPDRFDNFCDLLFGDRHRHGGVDVLAGAQRLQHQGSVGPALGEDRNSVDVAFKHCLEAVERPCRAGAAALGLRTLTDEVGEIDV